MSREIIYTTMENLPGRTTANNLMNIPGAAEFEKECRKYGFSFSQIEDFERDPALGNGGLGRLAACMAESAATKKIPMKVSVLRFRDGFFRQEVEDGYQKEMPDRWFGTSGRYPFEKKQDWLKQTVTYNDKGTMVTVTMVPYDVPVIGYGGYCNYIRMWGVEDVKTDGAVECKGMYYDIDRQLYPDDSNAYGEKLRLLQEYALSAVTVGSVIDCCQDNGWDLRSLPEHYCIHINDTHAALMIPELMRRLMCDGHFSEAEAWKVVKHTFVYTNHTILAEALKRWPIWLMESLIPDVYRIIDNMHQGFSKILKEDYKESEYAGKLKNMAILYDGEVHMARLAIWGSYSVNGVAQIHTNILCERELKDFYEYMPEKFVNVTNGVTQRKWLYHANPELSELLTNYTGGEEWIKDLSKIKGLEKYAADETVQQAFLEAKNANKKRLMQMMDLGQRKVPDTDWMIDTHVKRFHEYKRQQLNCLKIAYLYLMLKDNPHMDLAPTVFLFAGKAAPAYRQAKRVIKLVHQLKDMINNDPSVNKKIRVEFIKDFNVSRAEVIYAGSDLSEQISTASKEASGTGNMKFMMNGALTIGTLDGANVEICQAVGASNMYLFGMTAAEVMKLEAEPGTYRPMEEVKKDPYLQKAVFLLDRLQPKITEEWMYGENTNPPDRFFVLKDFPGYMDVFLKSNKDYQNKALWAEKCIRNIACSGEFTSDRMVDDYCEKVWMTK